MSFDVGGYNYLITSSSVPRKCTITGFTGGTVIPAVIIPTTATNGGNTYNVTAIGNNAFLNKIDIVSITITEVTTFSADNALTIGSGAFQGVFGLTNRTITIPKQVTSIDNNAFLNSNLLSLVFNASSNCAIIGTSAFTNSGSSASLAGPLVIPNTVTSIGASAFAKTKIESLTITEVVTYAPANALTIGTSAFSEITTLAGAGLQITIPKQVTVIGNNAFISTNLTSLVFNDNSNCTTIGDNAFTATIPTLAGALIIPATVTSIGISTFQDTKITSLTITETSVGSTNSLTIGNTAFQGILQLTNRTIIIPKQVTIIGSNSFASTNMTLLVFAPGSKCTTIGTRAFSNTDGVPNTLAGPLEIPNTVTLIGVTAFKDTKITSLIITDIGSDAALQANTLLINQAAFQGITTLTGAGQTITIPKQVTSISSSAFYTTNLTSLLFAPGSKCTTIGISAFSNCASLAGTLTTPATLTTIFTQAFVGTKLKTLNLTAPTTTLAIGTEAFLNVISLDTPNPFTIPANVTVATDAFKGTGLVFSVSVGGYNYITTSATTCTVTGFSGTVIAAVTIPATVVIAGSTYNVTAIGTSAFDSNTGITGVTLSEGLVTIGNRAFAGCGALIGPLTIPATVTSIGNYAFNATKITSLTITDIGAGQFTTAKALTIGISAFQDITTLTTRTITIPRQVTVIGTSAFYNTNLTALVFTNGSNCTTIGASAFTNDAATPTLAGALTIPNTVTSIGSIAFRRTKILSLEITDIGADAALQANTLTIGISAFSEITTLTGTITIPKQVTVIDINAFVNTNLSSLVFTPGSKCTTIGASAFTNGAATPTLAGTLTIPSTVTSIGANAFQFAKITSLLITEIAGDYTPANALTIGLGAFDTITTLTGAGSQITIPKQVTVIGQTAFRSTKITTLEFTSGSVCATIGQQAFDNCALLAGTLTTPATLTTIGTQAFVGTKLKTLNLTPPTTTLTIGESAFVDVVTLDSPNPFIIPAGVTVGTDAFTGTGLVLGPPGYGVSFTSGGQVYQVTSVTPPTATLTGPAAGTTVTTLTVPATATSGGTAFAITAIGANAYKGNTNVQKAEFTQPSNCATIGNSAFETCIAMTTLTLGPTITYIGANVVKATQIAFATLRNQKPNFALLGPTGPIAGAPSGGGLTGNP